MAQVDIFTFASGITALLLAAGLLVAWAINRSLTGFGWWAGAFLLLALWLITATLRLDVPAIWLKWLSWSSFYAAACLVAYGLYRAGATRTNPVSRMLAGAAVFLAVATTLTLLRAPPHIWLLIGPIPVLLFMAISTIQVFRSGAWGYGLTLLSGMAAIAIHALFHPGSLTRLLAGPPPELRGGFEAGSAPGGAIALRPRAPMNGLLDFAPPPGPRPPVEQSLTIALVTIVALLALAATLVLRNVLSELARMRERSSTDAMTGLLNRVTFEEAATALCRTSPRPVCAILFDIDHFKRINDTAGHAAGDRVISRLGQLLRELALPHCIAGRIGGEEFAVILGGSDLSAARLYAETIRVGLSTADFGDDIGWGVTVSAGIALHHQGESLHALTGRADRALYAAKTTGRDRIVVANDPAEGDRWQHPAGLATTA